ncbi:hypothetical protein D3C75_659780 [compost metagenome]
MIAKIRLAMKLCASGRGDEMNGHGNRCYIQNRHGRNIMRIDYSRKDGFIIYGDNSRNITKVVAQAIKQYIETTKGTKV